MSKTALITGASSGIGLELAKIHAANNGNLILVARSEEKLLSLKNELEKQFNVTVTAFVKDLSLPQSAQELYELIKIKNLQVDYLINNAGFGDFGLFVNNSLEKAQKMIHLNITSLTELCKLFLQDMSLQKVGKIMNVASTAAFQPGPMMAVYFATKAYVLSFSEALANEVKPLGITVTALCPGITQSGFLSIAQMEESKMVKGRVLVTSKQVAEFGYKAMLAGKTVAIHKTLNYILANANRFVPRNLSVKIARFVLDK